VSCLRRPEWPTSFVLKPRERRQPAASELAGDDTREAQLWLDDHRVIYRRRMDLDGQLFDPNEFPTTHSEDEDLVGMLEAVRDDVALVIAPDGLLARTVRPHSLEKAHYARVYADIVGTAMKGKWGGQLAWVELYCGPGKLFVPELGTYPDGSPLEALGIRHPFNTYAFVDLDKNCTDALTARIAERYGDRPDVHVLQGDANSPEVHDQLVALLPRNALIVLYADPAELNFRFDTIRFFAERYAHLDLLINLPLPGVVRALRAGHETKAGQVLDIDEPLSLIGPTSTKTNVTMRQYFESRLCALGYEHFASESIRNSKNSPLYDLLLASRDPRAKEFFEKALQRHPDGQYRMSLF
jgi:three-Cys-motif partner protein